MKAIFLTSSLGGYSKTLKGNKVITEIKKCDNSNHFIDKLKELFPKIKTLVFVASNPDGYAKTDEYANITFKALNLDGFEIKQLIIIDHRFNGDIRNTILSCDVVFLAGGNVPTQNEYFKEIALDAILKNYDGVVVGQSAGSMNCSDIVYAQPEEDEEFNNPNFNIKLKGLGLIDFSIMPHMNFAEESDASGHPTVMQMCLKDSFEIPHYGICDYGFIEVKDKRAIAYGKTFLIKDGKCVKLCDDGGHIELNILNR